MSAYHASQQFATSTWCLLLPRRLQQFVRILRRRPVQVQRTLRLRQLRGQGAACPGGPIRLGVHYKAAVLNGSTGEIDICDSPSGAAPCNVGMECTCSSQQAGGLLPRRPEDRTYVDCSLRLANRQFGLICGKRRAGGKKCAVSDQTETADCSNHGSCYTGHCRCDSPWACDDCSQAVLALGTATAVCPSSS